MIVPIFPIDPPEVLKGRRRVSLQPSLHQAQQPQVSQPVLLGEVLQPSGHFCGPPLCPLQQCRVFLVLRAHPELDAGLQVGSHQSRVEGQNHLPPPAGHPSLDAAQDTVGHLGSKHMLLAHVQLFVQQDLQDLLCGAVLNPFIPQPVLIAGAARPRCRTRFLWMASRPSGVSSAPLSLVSSAN